MITRSYLKLKEIKSNYQKISKKESDTNNNELSFDGFLVENS
jgi:hypothetical protein